MKRLILLIFFLSLLSGCKSTLEVTNRSDPKDFLPIVFAAVTGEYYGELVIEVPEEIRNDEFDITRADLFADIFADPLVAAGAVEISVDFYIGLESGNVEMNDPDINQYLVTVVITEEGQHNLVEIVDPSLLHRGMRQETFYLKALITLDAEEPVSGVLHLDNNYFIAYLERETEGLFQVFYFF
ncbi:MAG: hypothetical protein JW746_04215 [Candidatus Krumholzibacteriota bacterium]|nr:hypothetical protein [Candidatus Krumholzibacteriota bacterium]